MTTRIRTKAVAVRPGPLKVAVRPPRRSGGRKPLVPPPLWIELLAGTAWRG
ncbi:MAG: hypothetical protein U5S82_01335 [Gammaproteobacteria bacterium]|nr:hypothetical protein [Gammaproteobacteria bacterium]